MATVSVNVSGLSRGSLVCAGVVALAAVFAFLVLPRRLPSTPPSEQPRGPAAGPVAPVATASQVSADRRFGNGGQAPGGAGIGEPGI